MAGRTLQTNLTNPAALDDGTYGDEYGAVYTNDNRFLNIDLHEILAAIRRNIAWIIGIVAVTLAAGIVVTMLMVPRYVATAQVLVEQEADQIIEGTDLQPNQSDYDADRFLQTQVEVIRSRSLAQRVVESNRLANDPRFFQAMGAEMPTSDDVDTKLNQKDTLANVRLDAAIEALEDNLTVILPVDSRIIQISVRSADPALAAQLANGFADNFIEANLKRKFDSSAYARQFLGDQLNEARARVEKSERELNQYSRAAGLIRVSGQGSNADKETTLSVTNDSLMAANQAASAATTDRITAEQRWRAISSQPVLSVPEVVGNPAIQDLIKQKAELEAQLAQERVTHRDDYPTIKALQAQIAELSSRIDAVGKSITRSIYLNYEAAKQKEDSLNQEVETLRSNARDEQDRGVEYNVLKRVAETDRALYDTLLERFNQLNATAGSTSNNVTMVDRADTPRDPSSPKLILNLLFALVVGLALAGLFVLLREYFDDAIRTPNDVENKLGQRLLGLIPVELTDDTVTMLEDPKSTLSEAYHSLVANLRYSTTTGLPHRLAVTSAGESEGKTTTSMAIAMDLARLGKRVLLIDADLRRPTLHRRLSTPNAPGLTDVLTGNRTFDEVLHPSGQENLTFMTALPIPPDPSLQLGSDRLGAVVADASSRFDIVILDSPPLLGLSDTASIATHADGVLFIVDASNFRRGAFRSAVRRLNLVNANILGVAVTKFNPKTAGGDYGYYGYSYYNYGSRDHEAA